MSLTVTIVIFVVAALITGYAAFGDRRPPEPGRIWTPPYHLLMFIGILVMILMAAHIVTLVTGQPLEGRQSAW